MLLVSETLATVRIVKELLHRNHGVDSVRNRLRDIFLDKTFLWTYKEVV